jgi:hypothetical protein
MSKLLKCLFLLGAFCCITLCESTQYKIHPLGLDSATSSYPWIMNGKGDLLGTFETKGESLRKIFIWNKDTGTVVVDQIRKGSSAVGLNNLGQITGNFRSLDGWIISKWQTHPYFWSASEKSFFSSGFSDIGMIGSEDTYSLGIDDEGNILLLCSKDNQLYFWSQGKTTILKGASNIFCEGSIHNARLNNRKQIAFVQKDAQNKMEVFLMDVVTEEKRSILKNTNGVPYVYALNDEGDIAGIIKSQGKKKGFIAHRDGSIEYMDNFFPQAIRDDGMAVGQMLVGDNYLGAIYEHGKVTNIHDLMLPPEQQSLAYDQIYTLTGISNDGLICACVSTAGVKQAVVLIPE